jgi:hypothetical protein
MAYNTNSLNLNTPRLGSGDDDTGDAGLSSAEWIYRSADVAATVIAAGYIDDAFYKGLQVGDVVRVVDDTTPLVTLHVVSVVDTSTNPAGDATLV